MLLILAKLQRIMFLFFRKLLRTAGNRRTHYLIDFAIWTVGEDATRQNGIEIASFSKFTAVWYRRVTSGLKPGAIIGDGDRKSWDARGPMIWDNFSIFRTNCTILTSYIRVNPRTCRGFSRGCCHVA